MLVLGSTSLPKPFTDALAPWDLSALTAYEPRFLAGFRAEGYTVPVEEGYGEARAIMNAVIEQDVRRDIGGDQQRIGQMETEVGALTFKHVLLPVWLAAYRYRGKSFRFVVNGRTGAVQGERPYSAVKIALAIAPGAARRRHHRLPADRREHADAAAALAASPPSPGLAAQPAAADEPPPALIEATEEASALCTELGGAPEILAGYDTVRRPQRRRPRRLRHRPRAAAVRRRLERLLRLERLPGHRLAVGARRRLRPLRPRAAAAASASSTTAAAAGARRPTTPAPPAATDARDGCTRTWRFASNAPDEPPVDAAAAAEPAPAPAPEPATMPTGWTLRSVPGGSPVALGAGTGNIATLAAFCLEGQPFLAVTFHERAAAESVALDFAFSQGAVEAARRLRGDRRRRLRGGAGRRRRSPARLGGRDSEVAVSVDGRPEGTLSLTGSTRALRGALADCGVDLSRAGGGGERWGRRRRSP